MTTEALLGSYIGKYKIEELIGRGGMAEVYKAYQVNLDRHVAIKVMHKFLADDQDFLQRFEREARAMAASKHPNIVDVYDFDHDKDYYYIVMDYLPGGTLKNQIDKLTLEGGIIDLDKAIRIILEVSDALAFAHKRGMIHRDIKPANIMFNEHGSAVLTDFGIARMVNRTSNTTTGSMIGTPAYMSPEQGLGEPGDHRSDIYSLGILAYHLLTGQLPHEGDTPLSVVLKHINEVPVVPSKINPKIPADVEKIILKSIEKNPEHRYPNIAEMGRDLRIAAKSLSELNQTGEIPVDLLEQAKPKLKNGKVDNSITLPGTEDISVVDEIKDRPVAQEFNDATNTQVSDVKEQLQQISNQVVTVQDGSGSGQKPPAPTNRLNNNRGHQQDGAGMNLLPDHADLIPNNQPGKPSVGMSGGMANADVRAEAGLSPDQFGQQTENMLSGLSDFDPMMGTVGTVEVEVGRGGPSSGNPSNTGAVSTGPYEPIQDETYTKDIEGLYSDLDNNENEKALESKAKKKRWGNKNSSSKEAQVQRQFRLKRRVGSLLSFVFVLLGIALGYGLFQLFFAPGDDGTSMVTSFNTWLNEVSGGTTAEDGVDLSEFVYEEPIRDNGFSSASIDNWGYVVTVVDRDAIPSNWAALIEVEVGEGEWVEVADSKSTFNRDGEVAWPQSEVLLDPTRVYRWKIYNRNEQNSVIATSGPFVPLTEEKVQITEVAVDG